jgi:hypothetical protein
MLLACYLWGAHEERKGAGHEPRKGKAEKMGMRECVLQKTGRNALLPKGREEGEQDITTSWRHPLKLDGKGTGTEDNEY